MDFVFLIPPPPFYEGALADFEPTLDNASLPFPGED
jgi:hypothetical protein